MSFAIPPTTAAHSANRQIARSALIVMLAMVASQLVGLLAKALTGSTFGTGMESEAFFAANRFSEILFNLVAGGALGSAFIPVFTGLLAHEERPAAWKLASSIANLVLLVMTALSLLAAIFAPQVVRYLLAPGFASTSPEKEALTAALLRIQLPSAIIFGLSGLVMGVLNAHQRFLLPALAPAMYQVGWLLGLLALAPSMGIYGLAWGVVVGAALHLLLQIPPLLRLPELRYSALLGLESPTVREVARLMGPRLLSVAVVQLNFLLNTYLASLQPEGSLAGISLAFPLMIMPQAAIAQSAAIAALPTFSTQAARGKLDEMRASLGATLRGVLLLAIPATIGLVLLRRPLVALVYQRSQFTAQSVELVAWALLWYGMGLVGHCLVEVVARAFFALHDTKTPVMVSVAAMSLNLVFSLLFSAAFRRIGWAPHGGLALANSLATFLEMGALLVLMRRKLAGLQGKRIAQAVGQASLAAAGMAGGLLLWLGWSAGRSAGLVALGGVALGGLIYGLLVTALGVDEVWQAWALVRRMVSGKLSTR